MSSPTEIVVQLQPRQKEAYKKSLDTPILFFGGSKGGGKSYLVRAREMRRRMENNKSKGLIVRKTYPELLSNHIRKFFSEYPMTVGWYNKSEKTIHYPNGSTTEFSYLQNPDDVYTYQGREYDDISVDEVTQHEYEVIRILRSSLRTTNPLIKPRMFLTGNPGGPGHDEIKRIFIDRKFNPEENPADYAFVQAFVSDNHALTSADPEYVKRLEDLPDRLRKAYLEGNWEIADDKAFKQFSRLRHVIHPVIPNRSFETILSMDWGYSDKSKFAAYLIAVVPMKTESGDKFTRAITYKEWSGNGKTPEEWAEIIYKDCTKLAIKPTKCYPDSAMLDTQQSGTIGIGKLMENKWRSLHGGHWLTMIRSAKHRVDRLATVHNWLALGPDGLPYALFTENCSYIIDSLPKLRWDDKKIDDIDCFVAGTMIKTIDGDRTIETIKNGDLILTPLGYRKAYITGDPRKTSVTKVLLSNGNQLIGTSYHKVFVDGKGLIQLDKLTKFDILQVWNIQKLSKWFTTASNIEDTLVENITNLESQISKLDTQIFIVKFISTITDRSLMAIMSTILTIIRTIILLITLISLRNINMPNFTTTREKTYKSNSESGDSHPKEKEPYLRTLIKCSKEFLSGNWRAAIVANLLRPSIRPKNIALRVVKKITLIEFIQRVAQSVANTSYSKMSKQRQPVHIVAVGPCGEQEVYRLTVEKSHLYYANDVLVTNTTQDDHGYDGWSYGLIHIKYAGLSSGPHTYNSKAKPDLMRYNTSGQELAVDPAEFGNQYK